MVPTPTPAPPMPMQAMPAPIYFAAVGSMICSFSSFAAVLGLSMARMDRIVEIDAGENGEDVGLQEGHQQLQGGERDGEAERQNCAEPTEETKRAQHRHEAAEYLEGDVTGKHVGEQPYAVGDRSRQERQHLDERHQGQDVDRNSARHEQLEEAQPVLPEAVDHHREEHKKG